MATSFGKRFGINWTAPTADCRLWIKKRHYTGGSVALTPAPTPVTIRWDEQGQDDLTAPLRVSDASIRFIGDSDGELVEEIFDGGDTEYQVKFWRDTGSGYELEWEGYLATDLWRDNPHLPSEVIELEAIDGLALLEDREAYVNDAGEQYPLTDPLRKILRGWDPSLSTPGNAPLHDLPITTSQDWRPDGLSLPSATDDQPLDHLDLPNKAYQELDDREEVESTLDQRTQLEGIVERLGMQLMLSGGEWKLRQRDQIGDGTSLRQWTMGTSDTAFGNVYTADVTTSLPAVERTEKPRSRASRLQRLKSAFQYDDLGEMVANGSFEDPLGDDWTTEEPADTTITRKDYSNTPLSPAPTQEDSQVLMLNTQSDQTTDVPSVEQMLPATVHDAGPKAAYRFTWDLALVKAEGPAGTQAHTRIEIERDGDDAYLDSKSVEVQQEANAADEGSLYVSPIAGDEAQIVIPKGTTLPILKETATNEDAQLAEITLSEPAYGGDEELRGSITSSVDAGTGVVYWVWELGKQDSNPYTGDPVGARLDSYLEYPSYPTIDKTLTPQEIRVPQRTPTGDKVVGAPRMELSINFELDSPEKLWIDHVSAQLVGPGGEAIDQTTYIAEDSDFGREESLEHRIGDGPTVGHPRGLFDKGATTFFTDWGRGPGQGQTGKFLEQLLVEQWMRQQRATLDRRTYQVELRGSDSLKPHHVIGFDNKTYTVSYLERSYGTNGDSARVELTQLKDSGLAGLERAYSMESTGTVGSGGGFAGGGGAGGGGGGGGVSSWGQLTGKPEGLFAQNGDSDGIAETQSLAQADITTALGYTPADETVSINTDSSLSGGSDLSGDVSLGIATDGVTKTELDESLTYSIDISGDADTVDSRDAGDFVPAAGTNISVGRLPNPSVSVSPQGDGSGLNADQVDSYEGADLAALAEDETVTGAYTFDKEITANLGLTSGDDLMPDQGYSHSIGSSTDKWLTLDVAELRVSTLVAEKELATVGGRQLVGTANELTSAVATTDTSIEVKYNNLEQGDILRLGGGGSVEFMEVDSWTVVSTDLSNDTISVSQDRTGDVSSGEVIYEITNGALTVDSVFYDSANNVTDITVVEDITVAANGILYVERSRGHYEYVKVNRDLDGTGPNAWDQGDGLFSTSTGEGFIDLYAEHSFTDANQSTISGPTIEFVERTGTGYADVSTRAAIGNLEDTYGYGQQRFGFAAGDPSSAWVAADAENGFRVMDGSTKKIGLDPSGNAYFEGEIQAGSGDIGGWAIGSTALKAEVDNSNGNASGIELETNGSSGWAHEQHVCVHGPQRQSFVSMYAQQDQNGAFKDWGIVGVDGSQGGQNNRDNKVFHLGDHNEIGGWSFDTDTLSSGALTLDASVPAVKTNDGSGNLRAALGRLDGQFGISKNASGTYGLAAGDPNGAHARVTGDSLKLMNGGTAAFKINSSGEAFIGDSVNVGGNPAGDLGLGLTSFKEDFESTKGVSRWNDSSSKVRVKLEDVNTFSGTFSAQFKASFSTRPSSAGTTGGAYIEIPERLALQFAGKTVEISFFIKEDPDVFSGDDMSVAYSTNDVGNSGWQVFTPTDTWKHKSFTYKVPEPDNGGSDYLGILGSHNGAGSHVLVDNVSIRPADAPLLEDEIYEQAADEGTTIIDGGVVATDLVTADSVDTEDLFAENIQFTGSLRQKEADGDILFSVTSGEGRKLRMADDDGNTTALLTKQGDLKVNKVSGYDATEDTHGTTKDGDDYMSREVWHYMLVETHKGAGVVPVFRAPDDTAPAAPTGLTADPINGAEGIVLNWDANTESDLTGYRIYRAQSSSPGSDMNQIGQESSIGNEQASDYGPDPGETWYYRITAVDESGNESGFSSEASATA